MDSEENRIEALAVVTAISEKAGTEKRNQGHDTEFRRIRFMSRFPLKFMTASGKTFNLVNNAG
ncbi:MAG: hypothetical protein ACLFVG_02045 [Candidatus Aminicenantes bacterium]